MFRHTCPECSTTTYFRKSMVGRQTWCPNCQAEVRVRAQPEEKKPEGPAGTGPRAAMMTALLAVPLLGIVAWALMGLMPSENSDVPTSPAPNSERMVERGPSLLPLPSNSPPPKGVAGSLKRPGG